MIFAAKVLLQKDTTSPKMQKCFKKNHYFLYIFKILAVFHTFPTIWLQKRRKLLPASSHISYCVICFILLVPCLYPLLVPFYLYPACTLCLFLFIHLVPFHSPCSFFFSSKGTTLSLACSLASHQKEQAMLLLYYYSLATFINLSYSSRPLAVSR